MEAAWAALIVSLKVAGWATFLNLIFGIGIGFLLTRYSFPGRNVLDSLLTVPMMMPPTVLGYGLLVLLGRDGWIGAALENNFGISLILTWQGAVIATTIVSFPLVFRPARAAFESVDQQLEDAARVLGISESNIFFRITLPLAWRGILAGVLLGFARALGEFGATMMIAGNIRGSTQTLSVAVYDAVQSGQDGVASVLVAITFLICMIISLAVGRVTPRTKTER